MPISLTCLIHWCQWWLECVGHSRKRRKKYFMYSHHLANCLPALRTWIKTSWFNINLIVIFPLTGNTLHFSWVYLRLPRWCLIFHLTIPGLITFLPDNAVLIPPQFCSFWNSPLFPFGTTGCCVSTESGRQKAFCGKGMKVHWNLPHQLTFVFPSMNGFLLGQPLGKGGQHQLLSLLEFLFYPCRSRLSPAEH